ncbi:MAG: hypothetical protein R3B09_25975 [Nannocystaceae bacterium]
MLTSPAANPRLDSVMRLLGPLVRRSDPGAREHAEVIASLDAARHRLTRLERRRSPIRAATMRDRAAAGTDPARRSTP